METLEQIKVLVETLSVDTTKFYGEISLQVLELVNQHKS